MSHQVVSPIWTRVNSESRVKLLRHWFYSPFSRTIEKPRSIDVCKTLGSLQSHRRQRSSIIASESWWDKLKVNVSTSSSAPKCTRNAYISNRQHYRWFICIYSQSNVWTSFGSVVITCRRWPVFEWVGPIEVVAATFCVKARATAPIVRRSNERSRCSCNAQDIPQGFDVIEQGNGFGGDGSKSSREEDQHGSYIVGFVHEVLFISW